MWHCLGFFLIWDSLLSFFFGMEPVGGCCYLNYALKSLGLPGVDISPDFCFPQSSCHLK